MISEPISSLIHNAPEAGLFLDVGCGECYYTNILRGETREIISLDIQKPQTPLACENTFVLGSVEHLPFKEDSFDFIYGLSVIQLIRDDRAAIEEIFRILKPDGKLYLTIPTRRSAFRIIRDLEIRFGMYKHSQFNVKHYHYYAKKDIEILIQSLFKMESVSGYRYNFVPRLLNLLLDILTVRKNVVKLYHSTSIPKAGTHPSYIWKNSVKEFSEGEPQKKNIILKPLRSLLWPIYGLAYHYIIVLKKG